MTSTPETRIIFRRTGGHAHDGISSSLIDTTKYSLFDFSPSVRDTTASYRGRFQQANQTMIKNFIIQTVEERVLRPAGIDLNANSITAREIVSGTITANEIAANTITGNQIAANTISSDELLANLVLVNNVISSNNYVANTSGWAIFSNGNSEFNDILARGNINANIGQIGGWTIGSPKLFANTTQVITGTTVNFNASLSAGNSTISPSVAVGYTIPSAGYTVDSFINTSSITISGTYSNGKNLVALLAPGSFFCLNNTVSPTISTTIDDNGVVTTQGVEVGNGQSIRNPGAFPTTTSTTTIRLASAFGFEVFAKPSSSIVRKENIQDIQNPLEIIKNIRPRQFTWKPLEGETEEQAQLRSLDTSFGFIVEELLEDDKRLLCWEHPESQRGVGPQSIEDLNEWKPFYWRESDMTALLAAAVKELTAKVEELENRLNNQ